MPINVAHLELQLSGSGATTNEQALGGVISGHRILAQSTSGLSNVTGVVIDDAMGNAAGNGTLSFTFSGTTLEWQAFGDGTPGTAIDVSTDGKYAIQSSGGGFLLVTVTAASLPGSDQNDTITVANLANETFDNISSGESFAGDVEYRCYYVKNTHSTDTAYGVKIWIQDQPVGADSLAIGLDPAGVGDGSSTGVATTIGNESTAPAGVTFSTPASQGAGLLLGDLAPGECGAFWQRRTVPAETTVKTLDDYSNLGISAYL